MSEKTEKNQKQEEEFDIKDIYTPLSIAKREIWKRWNDPVLKKKVEDFLGGDMPEIFKKKPKAALFRFIATPNLEFRNFFDLSKMSKLDPVCVEFLEDRFCTRNQDKICLGRIIISDGKNKRKKKIINIQENDNKKFSRIKTLWGKSLVDFHHKIFFHAYKNVKKFDASQFKKNGENSREVYIKFLSLFLRNGILFENYIEKDSSYEKKFTNAVILPAMRKILKTFKIKPLIVPLLPIKDEDQSDWMWYPPKIENQINKILNKS